MYASASENPSCKKDLYAVYDVLSPPCDACDPSRHRVAFFFSFCWLVYRSIRMALEGLVCVTVQTFRTPTLQELLLVQRIKSRKTTSEKSEGRSPFFLALNLGHITAICEGISLDNTVFLRFPYYLHRIITMICALTSHHHPVS